MLPVAPHFECFPVITDQQNLRLFALLTELLRRDVKDERIGNVTITAVDVTGDLRSARVHYLVFGKDGPDAQVQAGLTSAAGFLRNALSKALMIRYTPTLSFALDTSIAQGVRLTQLIDSVTKSGKPE